MVESLVFVHQFSFRPNGIPTKQPLHLPWLLHSGKKFVSEIRGPWLISEHQQILLEQLFSVKLATDLFQLCQLQLPEGAGGGDVPALPQVHGRQDCTGLSGKSIPRRT